MQKDNQMENRTDKKGQHTKNYSKISKTILVSLMAIGILIALFFVGISYFVPSKPISGHNCFSQEFICSQNINYSPNGQISLNLRQKDYPAIYDVSFLCVSYNSSITNFTRFGSGILNTTNSTMPYNVTVHVSDIQCYNSTSPVHFGPNTTFKGVLLASFYTKNRTYEISDAAAIEIIRKG